MRVYIHVCVRPKRHAYTVSSAPLLSPFCQLINPVSTDQTPHHHSDHGYPLRCVVPGTVGARNVKWLGKVLACAK